MVTHVSDVLDLIGVSVLREGQTLLDGVTWRVREGERWVILGPNGAGKTTLLQITGARMHPTTGSASILGETLGAVDVFELRPRIGLSSAAFAERLPPAERVGDVVLTAAYAVAGRWRESYEATDHRRSDDLLAAFGVAHLADRTFGTLSEGERKRVQLARSLMTASRDRAVGRPVKAGFAAETLVRDLELAGDRRSPVLVLVTHQVGDPARVTHAPRCCARDGCRPPARSRRPSPTSTCPDLDSLIVGTPATADRPAARGRRRASPRRPARGDRGDRGARVHGGRRRRRGDPLR
jgi:iron complex transport system ATP-binding protein